MLTHTHLSILSSLLLAHALQDSSTPRGTYHPYHILATRLPGDPQAIRIPGSQIPGPLNHRWPTWVDPRLVYESAIPIHGDGSTHPDPCVHGDSKWHVSPSPRPMTAALPAAVELTPRLAANLGERIEGPPTNQNVSRHEAYNQNLYKQNLQTSLLRAEHFLNVRPATVPTYTSMDGRPHAVPLEFFNFADPSPSQLVRQQISVYGQAKISPPPTMIAPAQHDGLGGMYLTPPPQALARQTCSPSSRQASNSQKSPT